MAGLGKLALTCEIASVTLLSVYLAGPQAEDASTTVKAKAAAVVACKSDGVSAIIALLPPLVLSMKTLAVTSKFQSIATKKRNVYLGHVAHILNSESATVGQLHEINYSIVLKSTRFIIRMTNDPKI